MEEKPLAFSDMLLAEKLSLNEREKLYVRQATSILLPLSQALDFLQGDNGSYLGHLLPALAHLTERLVEERDRNQLCAPMAQALLVGLEARFVSYWSDKNALVAAAYVPSFKLDFLTDEDKRAQTRTWFLDALSEVTYYLLFKVLYYFILIFYTFQC